MQRYKLFEKTTKPSQTESKTYTNGSDLSPSDDPLDRLAKARAELKSVSEEEDEDTGQFHISRSSVRAEGLPKWSIGLVGAAVAVALLVLAIAWAWHLAKP